MTETETAPVPGSTPLVNAKWERFCLEYVKDLNATQAYIRAGYSAKDADVSGPRLLGNAGLQERVAFLKEEQFKALHMGANEVLALMATRARFNVGRIVFVTDDGDPYIDLSKANMDDFAALELMDIEDFVDSRERDEEGNVIARSVRRVKIKAGKVFEAQKTLMQHLGLLRETIDVNINTDLASELSKARKRAKEMRNVPQG